TALSRYLSAWMANGVGVMCQLYGASGTAVPGQASNPNPANGKIGVNISSSLSWTAGSGGTSRNVYFGTTNPPLIATTIGSTSSAPAFALGTTPYFSGAEK